MGRSTASADATPDADNDGLPETHEALRRVAMLVAEGGPTDGVFSAVVEEVARLLGAEFGVMRRYEPERRVRDVALWSRSPKPYPAISDEAVPLGGPNVSTLVFETGESARVDPRDPHAGEAASSSIAAAVRSVVGAPVRVDGQLWGVLLVASTEDQPLPAETDERLADFADLIATAIANAEARAQLQRIADEQAALRRVATLVAQSAPPKEVFDAVAGELRHLFLDADYAVIARFAPDETATIIAGAGERAVIGEQWSIKPPWVAESVYRTGRPARRDGSFPPYPGMTEELAALKRQTLSAVAAPVVVNSRIWGAVGVASTRRRLPDDAEQRLVDFTELVATAISNAEDRTELTASRARIVAAADQTRRRIERDLHDGIQQRLIRLALTLSATKRHVPENLQELSDSLSAAASELSEIVTELQEISRGIHPPVLAQGGLAPALRTLGRRATLPVDVVAASEERFAEQIEIAAYYAAAEALANVAKHASATRATISLEADANMLTLRVQDDGIGGADPRQGTGLVGLSDRLEALGGTIEIESPPREGTTLTVKLPGRTESANGDSEPSVSAPAGR